MLAYLIINLFYIKNNDIALQRYVRASRCFIQGNYSALLLRFPNMIKRVIIEFRDKAELNNAEDSYSFNINDFSIMINSSHIISTVNLKSKRLSQL